MWSVSPRGLTVLALLALAASAAAGEPGAAGGPLDACVRASVAAIQARYEGVRDLEARFEQTSRSVALGGPGRASTSTGTVRFAKPGKMRWSYEAPEPSLVVSDGQTLWLFDPSRREAQRLPVGGGYFSGASVQFLLGQGDILRDFEVTPQRCDEAIAELVLRPRQPESFERLEVRAERKTGDLLRTTVVDLLGNATEVSFSQIRVNQSPPADTFGFEPPAGVEVIDLAPPH
jgi:outer membrane lipoprotein carrier protein